MIIYSKNGKEIPLKNGVIINPGSFIQEGEKFTTVEKKSILIITKGEWNNQCQAREYDGMELKALWKKLKKNSCKAKKLWYIEVEREINQARQPHKMKNKIKATVEITDTYGWDANYSWVRRTEIRYHTERELIRAAKKFAGWTGIRCGKENYGETIILRPQGICQVMFIV